MPPKRPDVIVVADADALERTAAERILARLRRPNGRLAVCLAGGSTPERLYELLATEPYRSALSWNHIHWFWCRYRRQPLYQRQLRHGIRHHGFTTVGGYV